MKPWFVCCTLLLLLISSSSGRISAATTASIEPNSAVNPIHTAATSGPTLRVMSYNILHGEGLDRKYDLDRIASVIANAHADVVGLQEVDAYWGPHTHYDHQARLLATQLHMHYLFAPIYSGPAAKHGHPERAHGVAILSKYPILLVDNHPISRLSVIERTLFPALQPGLADAVIEVGQVPVRVYNVHLDYRKRSWIRRLQVHDILHVTRADPPNQIFLGDLNAAPDAPELAPLFARFQNTLAGCTTCFSYHAADPTRLIDYVLVSPGIHVNDAGVIHAVVSDHLPVVATITLSSKSSTRTLPPRKADR